MDVCEVHLSLTGDRGLNKGHTRNKNMVYAIVIKANFLADTACTDFTQ